MRSYELSCEIPANLSEEELKGLIREISELISKEGKIERISEPSKRRLAYPIKSVREIFLVNFVFESSPEKVKDIEKKLKM